MKLKSWSKKKDILAIDDSEAEKSFYQKTTDILLRNIAWFFIISGFLIIFFQCGKN